MSKSPIYPAYCFSKSPTYSQCVKLPIKDICQLSQGRELDGQPIFFHINHPIRFVAIVAPIVEIENIERYGKKYGLLTLDDGSGVTIVAKLNLLDDKEMASQNDCPSNTAISNVNHISNLGSFDVEIDGNIIDIGTVVKAKGTLEYFRGKIQVVLERMKVVKTTDEELRDWKDMARWKRDVLSHPWVLTSKELASFEKEETTRVQQRQREDESRRLLQRKRKAESLDKESRKEARRKLRETAMNAGALI